MNILRQSSDLRKPELAKTAVAAAISAIIASGCSLIAGVDRNMIQKDQNTTSQPEGGAAGSSEVGGTGGGGTINTGGTGGNGLEGGGGSTGGNGGNGGNGGGGGEVGGNGGSAGAGGGCVDDPISITYTDNTGAYKVLNRNNNGSTFSSGCLSYDAQHSAVDLGSCPGDMHGVWNDSNSMSIVWTPVNKTVNISYACAPGACIVDPTMETSLLNDQFILDPNNPFSTPVSTLIYSESCATGYIVKVQMVQ